MKVLLINGSPHKEGCTYTALCEAKKSLSEQGVDSEIYWIGKDPIPGCTACTACRKLGKCVIDDSVNELSARIGEFDGMIIGSPVYYSNVAGNLRCFLDRLFYSGGCSKLAGKPGAAVVSCRRGGATATYDEINKYFGINNMPIVTSNYWNQIHGNTAIEAQQDLEGLQTMRFLGYNMAWLLKCIDAGKEKGINWVVSEPKVKTNFIR